MTTAPGLAPTGNVDFTVAGVPGSVALGPDGVASLTTNVLPLGGSHLTAQFSGSTNFNTSATVELLQIVGRMTYLPLMIR